MFLNQLIMLFCKCLFKNNLGKKREHARMYRQQIKRLKESLSRILIEENAKKLRNL